MNNTDDDSLSIVTDKRDPAYESFDIKRENKRIKERRAKGEARGFAYRRVDDRITDVYAINQEEEIEKI